MTTQQTPMHFPIDECAKCTVRGDMGGCLATRCSLHENWYARTQQARITDLEAQLEAIGAGGVSGPLIGQPQAMPDLSQLTERGAKAWAGVDAQGLREGFTAADMATVSAQGFRDGVASVSAGSESMASYAIRLLVAAALITQAKADEALRLAAEITAAHEAADGERK